MPRPVDRAAWMPAPGTRLAGIAGTQESTRRSPAMPKSMNALELLRKDHRTVLTLLRKFEKSSDEREQHELCDELIAELDAHTALEEDCFYPYVRESTDRLD